jgi:hypothetical protein
VFMTSYVQIGEYTGLKVLLVEEAVFINCLTVLTSRSR